MAQSFALQTLRDLAEGQLLRSGEAVLVSAHSVVVLRWMTGGRNSMARAMCRWSFN